MLKTATYGGIRGSGMPILTDYHGTIIPDNLDSFAQHDYFIQPPTPCSDRRKDILLALKDAAPDTKRIAYVMGIIWPQAQPDPHTYYGQYRILVDSIPNSMLLDDAGNPTNTVNLIVAGPSLVNLWLRNVYQAQLPDGTWAWDGMFIDIFYYTAPHVNPQLHGYNTQAEFNAAWADATRTMVNRLVAARRNKGFVLYGNTNAPSVSGFTGWMLENWPHQNGGFNRMKSWYDKRSYPGPCVIFTNTTADPIQHPEVLPAYKYAAACAQLFDCILVAEPADPQNGQEWWKWEFPYYDLGAPADRYYMDGRLYRRDFELGSLLVDPTVNAWTGEAYII